MSSQSPATAQPDTPGSVPSCSFVSAHADLVAALPSPGQTWTRATLSETDASTGMIQHFPAVAQLLKAHTAIERVQISYERGTDMVEWRAHGPSYRFAQRGKRAREELPCGHRSGFDTVERGRYRCGFRWCEREYGREAVAEVFG